jgi:hypothetical protein
MGQGIAARTEGVAWVNLTAKEQLAAMGICYFGETWDRLRLPEWRDTGVCPVVLRSILWLVVPRKKPEITCSSISACMGGINITIRKVNHKFLLRFLLR